MAPFHKVLFVFLLLMCYTLCLPVYVSRAEGNKVSADIFVPEEIKALERPNGEVKNNIIVEKVKLPNFVVAKDGVMVAVAEAEYTEDKNVSPNKFDVLTRRFIANSNGEWYKDMKNKINELQKVQLATENNDQVKTFSTIMASTVNADGSNIYLFLLNTNDEQNVQKWGFKLVEGTINSGKTKDKAVEWNTKELTELQAEKEIKQKLDKNAFEMLAQSGSVFLTKGNKILFVVKGTFLETNGDSSVPKNVTVSFLFDKTETTLNLLHLERTVGWYSFFQWEGKIFKTPTNEEHIENNDNVLVLDVNKNNFTESNSSISHLRDFLKDKNKFVTTKIGGRDVLLLTQEKKPESQTTNVYLWITDGSRVGYVGLIATAFQKLFYGSVLYAHNTLITIYKESENIRGKKEKIVFTFNPLKKELENITNTLNAWNTSNIKIKKLCKNTSTVTIPCSTNGLVGFLSGDGSDNNNWQDEYLYMNASVSDGATRENGFSFNKKEAGAVWQVGKKENNNQLYNFTDSGFTLFATVIIDDIAEKEAPNSVLGVSLKPTGVEGITKNIGVFCNKDNEWIVSAENDNILKISNKKCEERKTYSVALVLTDENLDIYVDGEQLTFSTEQKVKINKGDHIEHFYFGADGKTQQAETDVTITNVLLYNRPFTTAEIEQLKPKLNNTAGDQTQHENDSSKPQNPNGSTTHTKQPPGTSANKNENKTRSSSTEDSAARVGVVGVLCFMLFGVFTLLGRHVY